MSQLEAQASNVEQVQPVPPPLVMSHPLQPQDYGNDAGIPDLAQSVVPEPENSLNTEDPKSVVPKDDDAATVLEFLAWGRNKDAAFGSTMPQASREFLVQDDISPTTNAVFGCSKKATIDLLEILLPDSTQISQLVEYHHACILWYHNSYSAYIFDSDLERFLINNGGNIRHSDLDFQWLALLFAILTGTLACSPSRVRHSWGFGDSESSRLALQWYEACVLCLNVGHYTERHTIHSVEAIATLTIAAHILGKSNSQSVLLSAAGRIAQSLGLHRLGANNAGGSLEQRRCIEAGRRVFNQLCTQDWFQIPFSESYSLNPKFVTSEKPINCNDENLERQPQSTPTQTSYCNYRYEIASLMPKLLDESSQCNTLFTKYEQVLKFDKKMRELATTSMPEFLSTSAAIHADWPVWISWGRRSLAICASHKIIMIHRRFLGLSFTNSAFSFTRRTCVAAAKTILKESLSVSDQDGPILWIEQAFSVAAGIVLCLDIAHREPDQEDLEYHATLMERTITYLKSFRTSKMASRGADLLLALQKEVQEGAFGGLSKRGREVTRTEAERSAKRARTLYGTPDVSILEYAASPMSRRTQSINETLDNDAWEEHHNPYHIDTTLGPQGLFDDLLSFKF